ncbi:MAG: zinc-ribbon domain-containing protein [bacterium]
MPLTKICWDLWGLRGLPISGAGKKNGALRPTHVTAGSHEKVWWKCKKGEDHEWEAAVKDRSRGKKERWPFCAGKRVSVTNCLSTTAPELAAEWDVVRNGEVTAADVITASKEFAWWTCPVGHAYRARISDRTVKGRGCPVCAER